jgi:hypothetical protein
MRSASIRPTRTQGASYQKHRLALRGQSSNQASLHNCCAGSSVNTGWMALLFILFWMLLDK